MNNATIIRKLSLQIFLALKKTKSNVIEIIVEMLKLSTPNVKNKNQGKQEKKSINKHIILFVLFDSSILMLIHNLNYLF